MKTLKKVILTSLIFVFIVVCNDTPWIEHLFNLDYPMGLVARSYLLGLIASILIWKK